MELKFTLVYVLYFALLINVILYVYRNRIERGRKEGGYLKAGVWRAGSLNKTPHSFYWSFFRIDFRILTNIGSAILAMFAGVGALLLSMEVGLQMPLWVAVVLVLIFLILFFCNFYYLLAKVRPLMSRYYLEYKSGALQLLQRVSGKQLVAIDFNQPYQYKKTLDVLGPGVLWTTLGTLLDIIDLLTLGFLFSDRQSSFVSTEVKTVHIFIQNNMALALMHQVSASKIRGVHGKKPHFPAPELKDVDTVYEVRLDYFGDCNQAVSEIIKSHISTSSSS
ncbi:MAG: hypothetical protein AAB551_03390 [Patescibacteria group bacterium]